MKSYLAILKELGWPRIYLVSDEQMHAIDGDSLYRDKNRKRRSPDDVDWGMSALKAPTITLYHGLRGKALWNTIYHEILHILYPYWKHWRVECCAEVLARGGGHGYWSEKFNHTVADVQPRDRLIWMIRRQVKKFNRRRRY